MASYLKQRFYEYRERKYLEPSFRIYSDASGEAISEPIENSLLNCSPWDFVHQTLHLDHDLAQL